MTSELETKLSETGSLHFFHNEHKKRDLTIDEYIKKVPALLQAHNEGLYDTILPMIKKLDELHVVFLFLPENENICVIHHDRDLAIETTYNLYLENYEQATTN